MTTPAVSGATTAMYPVPICPVPAAGPCGRSSSRKSRLYHKNAFGTGFVFSFDGSGFGGQNYDNDIRRNKYKYGVTVCSKTNCVVLLPDNWDGTVISLTNFAAQNTYDESSNPKRSEMEAAGAVCLPAAGYRKGFSVKNVGGSGSYWSSTALGSGYAYYSSGTADGSKAWYMVLS